ncbi:hypothetical protein GP486_008564, partial [Trichoglossum hirsutum]
NMLYALGADGWSSDYRDESSLLTEVAGRLCYKAFGVGLNPNITRVREGNMQYVNNLLDQLHGSVLEHSSVSFALLNVSRILTHELVRHRVGIAFSQESQRFVRLDRFSVWVPDLTPSLGALWDHEHSGNTDTEARDDWIANRQAMFLEAVESISETAKANIAHLVEQWGIDANGVPFHIKKGLTSALRRFVPGGVQTHIIVSANHRTWRHNLNVRTAPGAEQEIVECFDLIGEILVADYPAIYQDVELIPHDTGVHFKLKKV